ncbi:MAG: hypothetical protein ACRD26_01370 [Vicinamibacterales bacterium]
MSGASADREIVTAPVYDVKVLDRLVTRVAREIRLLEPALKATNAKTTIDAYKSGLGPPENGPSLMVSPDAASDVPDDAPHL